MKKAAVALLLTSLLMLSSCGNTTTDRTKKDKETTPTTNGDDWSWTEPEPEPASILGLEVSNTSIFEKGYYCMQYSNSGVLYFEVRNASDTPSNWSVYIVDSELTEDEVNDLQTKEPALVNAGEVDVTYDQWIYVFCDVNSETSSEPNDEVLEAWGFADYA